MDNRLNEMSKKFDERENTLTNQFNDFQKNQTQQPIGALFPKTVVKNQILPVVKIA